MALVQIAGGAFGEALRVTDSIGGCISFGAAPIGSDADFLGPLVTLGTFFRKIDSGTGVGMCRVGVADLNGSEKRIWLEVEANTPNTSSMRIRALLNTTACGAVTVDTHDFAKDTNWHSVLWTYDQAGSFFLYLDGVQVGTGASPCANISAPTAASDLFTVFGSRSPGLEFFHLDNPMMDEVIWTPGQVSLWHSAGFPG